MPEKLLNHTGNIKSKNICYVVPKINETNMMYAMSLKQILIRGGIGKLEI